LFPLSGDLDGKRLLAGITEGLWLGEGTSKSSSGDLSSESLCFFDFLEYFFDFLEESADEDDFIFFDFLDFFESFLDFFPLVEEFSSSLSAASLVSL
jgi:hypothetical protein